MATYTSTKSKKVDFFFSPTWHMELPAHSFWGEKPKNGNGIGGKPGWSSQNEDDGKGQEGRDTQLAPLVTLQPRSSP